jgi:serine/threonine protein kinase/Tol biopolymer transport system component
MSSERWRRIEELYHSALNHTADERAAFIAGACGNDDELRGEVESLLRHGDSEDALFDQPAFQMAADLLGTRTIDQTGSLAGLRVSHYEILEKLGEGGMGQVYKARDTRLGRLVAIKTLPQENNEDTQRRRRFEQEARAASALDHPNIVSVYDIDKVVGFEFIAMEYVAGETLSRLIGPKGLSVDQALDYAIQMADALAAAHAAGIVHRDLKPGNVMATEAGVVKLLDFGVAKLTEPLKPGASDASLPVETEKGTVIGTTAYMSPEQAQGKPVDARSDIFSFGAVLYEMLTGERAFQGDTQISTVAAILEREPVLPREIVASIPEPLERLILRCLRKQRGQRFQHMEEPKVLLQEIRKECEIRRLAAAGAKPSGKHKPGWLWPAGLLLALAIAIEFVWLRSTRGPSQMEAVSKIPLTSYPGMEWSPTFSPDGRQVAFAWNGESGGEYGVYVKMVEGGEPLRLTQGEHPRWSPDGRLIAFYRLAPRSSPAVIDNVALPGSLYLIPPLGGAERKFTDGSDFAFDWMPDSKSIIFVSRLAAQRSAIFLLNLATDERRRLTDPPAGAQDTYPSASPDGKSLAFVRYSSAAGGTELMLLRLSDGSLKRIETPKHDFLYEMAWTPGGKEIVAVVEKNGGIASLWRVPIGPGRPSRIPGPDDGARYPAVSALLHRLAYSARILDVNVWSLAGGPAVKVIASTRRDFNPQFSPDEKKIAFVSDRSGAWEIYTSDPQGGHLVQITSFGGSVVDSVRWSPDGRQLAFGRMLTGNRDIYIVPSEGGPARRMTAEPSDDGRPDFSQDGRWIYFRSDRTGRAEIWKMPREGGAAIQVTRGGGFDAYESLDGNTLYFTRARTARGLWSMPVGGGAEQPVAGLESVWPGGWGSTNDGVCFLKPQVPDRPILCWNSTTRELYKMGGARKETWTVPPFFSVSRDGRHFLWHQIDRNDADLVLVENFQ